METDPTLETEPYDEGDEEYADDNDEVEEVDPPEEDIPYPILLESNNEDIMTRMSYLKRKKTNNTQEDTQPETGKSYQMYDHHRE